MNTIKFLILAGIALVVTSCYEKESVPYDELDVTLTKYETSFDFTSYGTFAIPDSTVLKSNYLEEDEIDDFYAPGGTSETIITAISDKFNMLGYTHTDIVENADFIAVPTVLLVKSTGAVYYPPGWWWGYPGWGGGWGWNPWYPWNPGYVGYYSYKEGSLIMEIVDGDSYRKMISWEENNPGEPSSANDIPELKIRWMATIDGYVSSNADYNQQRAERGFNEAFEQSPYLGKN